MVERLFLAVPWGCLQFVIGVFPDHTHLLCRGGAKAKIQLFHNTVILHIKIKWKDAYINRVANILPQIHPRPLKLGRKVKTFFA